MFSEELRFYRCIQWTSWILYLVEIFSEVFVSKQGFSARTDGDILAPPALERWGSKLASVFSKFRRMINLRQSLISYVSTSELVVGGPQLGWVYVSVVHDSYFADTFLVDTVEMFQNGVNVRSYGDSI